MRLTRVPIVPSILLLLLTLTLPRLASAGPVTTGNIIRLYDSFGTTGGGEFNAQIVGTSSAIDFITFCMEINEYFAPGQDLLVKAVSRDAVGGGAGGGNPDPLDNRTAYLYSKFTEGTLSNYAFGDTGSARVADANSLQRAFWFIEQELGASYTLGQLDALDHQAALWVQEAQAANWTSPGNVYILNLFRKDSQGNFTIKAQDQLYYQVPEPGSLVFLSVGFFGLTAVARRLKGTRPASQA